MAEASDLPQAKAGEDLTVFLARWRTGGEGRAGLAATVEALARASAEIAAIVRLGPLTGAMLAAETGEANSDGDRQKKLDVLANDAVLRALGVCESVAYFASEEEDEILSLRAGGDYAVAVDPLDGSSNIDANTSIGTIFSVFPASPDGATESFFRPGAEQVAAGYAIYGPYTSLVLTLGAGVELFVLGNDGRYRRADMHLSIPKTTREYAINASNYRYWREPVRDFVDDLIAGAEGPRGKNFNMRWLASLVGETHRILLRGGVFLYPADKRPGYEKGRLRLIYEAAPIALLVEQAGGAATDGLTRMLDKIPASLHERTPLVFGSADKVGRVSRYHTEPTHQRARSPLFGERGLFRV
jgi:fructose-1,6-bisphosphatase I